MKNASTVLLAVISHTVKRLRSDSTAVSRSGDAALPHSDADATEALYNIFIDNLKTPPAMIRQRQILINLLEVLFMKRPIHRISAIILTVALFATCAAFPVQASQQGGYSETRRNLPDLAYINSMYETGSDTFQVFGKGNLSGEMEVWETADSGATWQRKQPAWLKTINSRKIDYIFSISPVSNDKAYAVCATESSGGLLMYPAIVSPSKVEIVPTNEQNDAASMLKSVYSSSAGLLCFRSDAAVVVNPQSGKIISTFTVNQNVQTGQISVTGSTCAIMDGNQTIRIINLLTGESVKEIPVQAKISGSSNAIVMGVDENSYYYCDQGGLYRVMEDKTEQVMDSAGTALNKLSVGSLFQLSDGSFVLLGFENDGGSGTKTTTGFSITFPGDTNDRTSVCIR